MVCEIARCVGTEWDYVPSPSGTTCTTVNGTGKCDGAGDCSSDIPHSGSLHPSYYILSVMYAPPGSASLVDYGVGSTFGTTTSAESSFSQSASISVEASADLGVVQGAGFTVTGTKSGTSGSGRTEDIKATTTAENSLDGLGDVINHDLDRIYLLLKPTVNVTILGNRVSWAIAAPAPTGAPIQYAYVGWLRHPSTMPADVASTLAAAGITPADYPVMLTADPFATSSPAVNTARFKYMQEIPYEPPAVQGQAPTATKFGVSRTGTITTGTTSSTSYSVKMEITGGLDFFGLIKTKLTASDTLTWTSSNADSNSTASTVSANASIMQPAVGYTGRTALHIYLDTVYNTFLFSFD